MIGLDNLLRATAAHGGETVGPVFSREFAAFSNDSRTVAPGEMFVALRTEKADGHAYIADAIARGATGVLCERPPEQSAGAAGVTVVRVGDTRAALRDWAGFALATLRPSSIAVVGAVGKSSACAALLRALGAPGGSPEIFTNGNRNDELGLPLALGELLPSQRLAVLELAGSSPAELQRLLALVQPQTLLLTAAGQPAARDAALVSLREGLPAALAEHARLSTVICNGDDGTLLAFLDYAGLVPTASRVSYSIRHEADIAGQVVERSAAGSTVEVCIGERIARFAVRAPGDGAVYAALAAVAAATQLRLDLDEIAARLDGLPPEPGRLAPLPGAGGRIVLDDTFNASEASLWLALKTLDLFPRPHVGVLGEISGLRRAAEIAEPMQRRLFDLDRLVLQGPEMAALGRELRGRAPQPERVLFTYSARDSADAVAGGPEGGTVLVKGSDAARMERVVELLLPEGERARAALVRQDEGWRRRTYVPNERPTWVEVDLDAIRANLRALQAAAAPAEVLAVLKADAYGHGARWVARTVALNGAAMLGVASLNEALELRADGITTPILILGYSPPWQARDLALSDIQATVFSLPVAQHYARTAADLGREIAVHIKVDTGLTRLGVLPEDVPAFVDAVAALPGLRLEGIFSHMATSDSDVDFAVEQGERFAAIVAALNRAGHRFRYVHIENSAAVMRRLPFQGNLVRVGLGLYGLYPLPPSDTDIRLQPALSFKTRVAQVKSVPAGTGVSYGRTFVTQRPSRIAVLPVGYGDGFRRSPANWGQVLVRGRRAPIVGVVAMDMTMIDVTEVDGVQEGDEVVLIGRQGEEAITVEDVAAALGTISYEVVTQILPRVPRQAR